MAFSSAVVLTDLNDYINPSQACIKPVETPEISNENAEILLKNGQYYEVQIDGTEQQLETASISLNDCLACSGCITSAESVLITLQNNQEFLKIINDNLNLPQMDRKIICISISSQSRASIGAKFGFNAQQTWQKLSHLLKSYFHVDYVFDIDFARDIALLETGKSFVERMKQNDKSQLPLLASSCPGIDATILISILGFICYAEKTHGTILNLVDSTKSPQQIMGSIVKDHLASQIGKNPDQIYHVSVMPCFDKKLEASRTDFYNDMYRTRDVDLVLSTTELEIILQDEKIDLNAVSDVIEPSLFMKGDGVNLYSSEGSSSGGYLSYTMRYAASVMYGVTLTDEDISKGLNGVSIVPGRNSDFTEVNFTPPGHSEPALRFVYVYGFKNIQNLVRKVKLKSKTTRRSATPSAGTYHYAEVMACPSGCINGGGQLKPNSGNNISAAESKNWISKALSVYNNTDGLQVGAEVSSAVQDLYQNWLQEGQIDLVKKYLHTSYHAVENNFQSGLAVKW
ncbi:iron hydrogenase [Globomyces pollinis-pini]|nr:iron hydrogenase [Globomyces pollinis-pini]KAJ3000793.1 hypothetical protein HDV02_003595 [Globomyces sp. JEL0801]